MQYLFSLLTILFLFASTANAQLQRYRTNANGSGDAYVVLDSNTDTTSPFRLEDDALSSGHAGTPFMCQRNDTTGTIQSSANGDAVFCQTNNLNSIYMDPQPNGANGNLSNAYISAATTNSTNVKNSAGRLFTVTACGASATARYIKIYSTSGAPTCGSGTPALRMVAPANSCTEFVDPIGMQFGSGIGFCITGAAGDADTTAVTANDTYLTFTYR